MELDTINLRILAELQVDARVSWRELGDRVGLSAPAVAERVRRMEDAGVITGYRTRIDAEALGYPILAIIRIRSSFRNPELDDLVAAQPEVIECHRVTGRESHVIRALVRSTAHLEELLQRIGEHGDTETNIVTSSPVPTRGVALGSARRN